MPEAFVGIGSNLDKERHIPAVLAELASRFGPLLVSGIYENPAVGFAGPLFHNLVVGFHTHLPVSELAEILAGLETAHGRTRESGKLASHTLDLDLLLYGDEVVREGKLQLPRADTTRHAFVLEPLAEIAPDRIHPLCGESFAVLWAGFDKRGLEQVRLAGDGGARVHAPPGTCE